MGNGEIGNGGKSPPKVVVPRQTTGKLLFSPWSRGVSKVRIGVCIMEWTHCFKVSQLDDIILTATGV